MCEFHTQQFIVKIQYKKYEIIKLFSWEFSCVELIMFLFKVLFFGGCRMKKNYMLNTICQLTFQLFYIFLLLLFGGIVLYEISLIDFREFL